MYNNFLCWTSCCIVGNLHIVDSKGSELSLELQQEIELEIKLDPTYADVDDLIRCLKVLCRIHDGHSTSEQSYFLNLCSMNILQLCNTMRKCNYIIINKIY